MKLAKAAAGVVLLLLLSIQASARELIPVGQILGLQLSDGTVSIVGFDEEIGKNAQDAGLRAGDVILKINGQKAASPELLRRELTLAPVQLRVRRGNREWTATLRPIATDSGPRLGILLRQGVSGIGTVTWYDPAGGRFGALGHGVSGGAGKLLDMEWGSAYPAEVLNIKRGEQGTPGQLRGIATSKTPCGKLLKNTPQGVFGLAEAGWEGKTMKTADYADIRPGEAWIRSTILGNTPRDYSVELMKIYPEDQKNGRNFLIRVTDPALLEATGGIVQGMSGSPIMQNGKLIGAVTHVLVNRPDTGYGIYIENMLDAAG